MIHIALVFSSIGFHAHIPLEPIPLLLGMNGMSRFVLCTYILYILWHHSTSMLQLISDVKFFKKKYIYTETAKMKWIEVLPK